jgi:2'-hydroxyisoflavone reductase
LAALLAAVIDVTNVVVAIALPSTLLALLSDRVGDLVDRLLSRAQRQAEARTPTARRIRVCQVGAVVVTEVQRRNRQTYGRKLMRIRRVDAADGGPTGGDSSVLIARSGLIGGPGNPSDRAGYWVARAARDRLAPMLVPDSPDAVAQVIDIRDLAAWLINCAERRTVGVYDAVGPMIALAEWIELSRTIGGHTGDVVRASDGWLSAQGVEEFMGPESLPLWLADPEWQGFCARSGDAAVKAGLTHRPISDTLTDTLAWERQQGLDHTRKSGISAEREAELLTRIART